MTVYTQMQTSCVTLNCTSLSLTVSDHISIEKSKNVVIRTFIGKSNST